MPRRDPTPFVAHTPANGWQDPVIDHLLEVARLATTFAARFAPFEAEIAGLTHDMGKYGDLFQQRLRGEVSGIDHWTLGASSILKRYRELGLAAALAVQGHHVGLRSAQKANLDTLNPAKPVAQHPSRLSESDPSILEDRYLADGGVFPEPPPGISSRFLRDVQAQHSVAAMLDVRLLFSALVDADYLATEAHFDRGQDGAYAYRAPGRVLDPDEALAKLDSLLETIRSRCRADPAVRSLREDLQQACADAGSRPPGLYTLTAPTGAGKTLAMLLFALKHAREHGLSRIIVVLPFLTLIEQTARIYRDIFGDDDVQPYVLEDHSMTEWTPREAEDHVHLLTENWDAPIIVTTSVRFFESLFANRPSACRKLHNVARSVILLDEVQTLPAHLAVPTLAALSHLKDAFGCTIVLSTATQPAFSSLGEHVSRYAPGGWQTAEIAPPELGLFTRVRRVQARWPEGLRTTALEEVAEEMLDHPQALAIVNVKRHARRLYELIADRDEDGAYHLSTNMCPAHRAAVLREIRHRLESGSTCRVASTQCVEAGVDLDFPVLFRAWGPLESLAQAAGRCNREGRLTHGEFFVFLPPVEEEVYPGQAYKMAAAAVKKLFQECGGSLDLQDPTLFQTYYREFYGLANVTDEERELVQFLKTYDFAEVAECYRLIDNDTINVLVPYARRIEDYRELRDTGLSRGLSREWLRRARPLAVNLYKVDKRAARKGADDWLEPIRDRGVETGWYIYLNEGHYSEALGLVAPEVQELLLA